MQGGTANEHPLACLRLAGQAELAEGPVWLAEENAVYFVDIKGAQVHRLPSHRETADVECAGPGGLCGAAGGPDVSCAGCRTACIASMPAAGSSASSWTSNRIRRATVSTTAFVDASGHLWFGSMDDAERRRHGTLYRVNEDGDADGARTTTTSSPTARR